jgi:drug/metabolite transporter (DMT)-like permease
MPIAAAFILCVLIWGSTWYAIEWQLGHVAQEWSLTYRYAIATFVIFAWCIYKRRALRFDRNSHFYMAATGLFLFSGNYILVYYGTAYLTSGLVAVTFALLSFLNIINARLFVGAKIRAKSMVAAVLGVIGLALVFKPEIQVLSFADATAFGLAICLLATLIASWGNTVLLFEKAQKVPVLPYNAWSMAYGTLFNLIFALALGESPALDPRAEYYWALLYLAVPGTVIAFSLYIWLISQIGAANAGYIAVLTPLVALGISTAFEGYSWTLYAVSGLALVMIGNILMVLERTKQKRAITLQK